MSAVIQNEYTGNGTRTDYPFTFPYLKTSDIKASLDGVETTAFTLPNATTLQFNNGATPPVAQAPANGVKIKIFRETGVDNLTATFYAGSAIKSEDLNDNFTQNLYKTQEVGGRFISNLGGTMTGDLNMGEDTVIKFEGATDDAHETTLTVADPTADRTITLPNVTGTVVTTGDTGTVATGMIADSAIISAKIADGAIQQQDLASNAVTTAKILASAVTTAKIADSTGTSDGVTTAKIADQAVTLAKLPHGTGSTDGKFLRANNGADPTFETIPTPSGFVTGMIIMWNSTVASIPSGFVLCDGNNSTPDLRDKFIVGAKQDDSGTAKTNVTGSLTQTGGSATHTLTEAEMPSHVHHVQITTDSGSPFGSVFAAGNNSSQGFVATTSKGSGNAHNNLPPYYALCFIMKT